MAERIEYAQLAAVVYAASNKNTQIQIIGERPQFSTPGERPVQLFARGAWNAVLNEAATRSWVVAELHTYPAY